MTEIWGDDPPDEPAATHGLPADGTGAEPGGRGRDQPACSPTGLATVGGRDGGVSARLARRSRVAAVTMLLAAGSCLLATMIRDWDPTSAVLAAVVVGGIIGFPPLWRRGGLWTAVTDSILPPGSGSPAVTGQPRPLSPRPAGSPLRRRFGALVVPLRARSGPTPGNGALIVHGRADAAAPAADEQIRVLAIGPGRPPIVAGTRLPASGRFLLLRERDGLVFVATTRLTDIW